MTGIVCHVVVLSTNQTVSVLQPRRSGPNTPNPNILLKTLLLMFNLNQSKISVGSRKKTEKTMDYYGIAKKRDTVPASHSQALTAGLVQLAVRRPGTSSLQHRNCLCV